MGNGNRAAQKRERNAKEAGKGEPKSQLQSNLKAMDKICNVCRQSFMTTTTKKDLDTHAEGKHGKKGPECFGEESYKSARDAKVK